MTCQKLDPTRVSIEYIIILKCYINQKTNNLVERTLIGQKAGIQKDTFVIKKDKLPPAEIEYAAAGINQREKLMRIPRSFRGKGNQEV